MLVLQLQLHKVHRLIAGSCTQLLQLRSSQVRPTRYASVRVQEPNFIGLSRYSRPILDHVALGDPATALQYQP